jgi:hypothetical protein
LRGLRIAARAWSGFGRVGTGVNLRGICVCESLRRDFKG